MVPSLRRFAPWLLTVALCADSHFASAGQAPLEVAPSVDFNRYAGTWYEIARLPNRFQRHCSSNVTATYTLRPDGKIQVLNQCSTADGKNKTARGVARPAGGKQPTTKLKVGFFWPFSGDYWILELDPDYRWAVVGEPRRRYLWILSCEPHMAEETYQDLLKRAAQKGFDVSRLLRTPHTS